MKRAWAKRRQAVLERDGHRCRQCGNPGALEVHHLAGSLRKDYRARVLSPQKDLVALCRTCHLEAHGTTVDLERTKWTAYVKRLG